MRWLRQLKSKDIALDRSMIPLGSCTMKLNAAVEMEAITWPAFADLHPFVPVDRAEGTLALIGDLERWLAEITGYDAVSLQPNAGSQGELAGLLAIRGYHRANGDLDRDVCLIPSSAHGTNAASAVMAGMRVKVVACDDDGNVDVDDLRRLVTEHADTLAALMVTYPSTHGVFEAAIDEICALVHDHGGQVYLDGANLNALVGVARPGSVRCGRQPPQPPQDVLHPARWWEVRASARWPAASTWLRSCRPTRWWRSPAHPAARALAARAAHRTGVGGARGARRGSCRSRGPTWR
jgi:glycine dehydrogenase